MSESDSGYESDFDIDYEINSDCWYYPVQYYGTRLVCVVKKKDITTVKRFIKKGNDNFYNAILHAANCDNLDTIKFLIQKKANDYDNAIHYANIEIKEYLEKNYNCYFPLQKFEKNSSIKQYFCEPILHVSKYYKLIQKGASISEIMKNEKNEEYIIKCIQLRDDTYLINEELLIACIYGHINVIKFLIENGANNLNEALEIASTYENIDIIKLLIENGANNLNEALEIAICSEKTDVVKFLIEKGASVSEKDLISAVKKENIDIVKILVQNSVNDVKVMNEALLNINVLNYYNFTDNLSILKFLIENGANDFDKVLIKTLEVIKISDIAEYILENFSVRNDTLNEALLLISKHDTYGYSKKIKIKILSVVKLLVQKGANNLNESSIGFVNNYNSPECFKIIIFLIKNGANNFNELLLCAVNKNPGKLDIVKLLIQKTNVNNLNEALKKCDDKNIVKYLRDEIIYKKETEKIIFRNIMKNIINDNQFIEEQLKFF